jgi:hypothetical protein
MSTVAPKPPLPPRPPLTPALLDSERYIDDHLRRTRRSLKLVDFTAGAITLLAALLLFLLAGAVLDQWVVPGGLNAAGRGVLFAGLVGLAGWIGWRHFVPLLKEINPVYAAHTIEQTSPTLKNSLLNLILFRNRRRQMSAKVYHALEQQAAQRLSTATLDGAVDHSALLRLGYVLMLVVALCAVYAALSPKNLATSAGRVLAPWSDIAAPTRVQILDVKPGDASIAKFERLNVSAEIHGVRRDEPVRLRYSTNDQSRVDETVPMSRPADGVRFEAQLPRSGDAATTSGVQQDLTYWIEAGDAHTRRYKLTVFDRPTMVVQRVHYEFPAYTGMPSADTTTGGDVSGIEGTRVTIEGVANQPIKSAAIDFDADGKNDLAMTVQGDQRDRAVASFVLALRPDRRTPVHTGYALRLVTTENRTNVEPPQYRIEVTPDYAPEVRLTKPEEAEKSVRADEIVVMGVDARDPDFALQQVRLVGKVGDREVLVGELLSKNHAGRLAASKPVVPADSQLKPGDVLEYWAEARDNRRPEVNVAFSDHRRLRIVGGPPQGAPNPRQQPKPGEPQQGDNQQNGGASQGAPQGGQQQADGQNGEPSGDAGQQQGAGAAGGGQGDKNDKSDQDNAQPTAGGSGGQSKDQPSGGADAGAQPAGEQQQGAGDQSQQKSDQGAAGQQSSNSGGDQNNPSDARPAEGNQSGNNGGGQSSKVSPEGDDDGEAMSRMREHFANQDATKQAGGQKQNGQAGENQDQSPANGEERAGRDATAEGGANQQPPQQGAGQPRQGESKPDAQPQDGSQPSGQAGANARENPSADGAAGQQQPGSKPNAQKQTPKSANPQAGQPGEGAPGDPSQGAQGQNDQQRGAAPTKGQQAHDGQAANAEQQQGELAEQNQNNANAGDPAAGERRGPAEQLPDKSAGKPSEGDQQNQSPQDGMNRNQRDAGSGHPSAKDQASPDMGQGEREAKMARDKQADDASKTEGDKEPPGASGDSRESNSEGGQGGDATGGGQQGGGQHADAPGKGDPGQHETADQGAGQSNQQGEGQTGKNAGEKQQAQGKTGRSSQNQRGAGSQKGDAGGEEPGSESGEQPMPGKEAGDQGKPGDKSTAKPDGPKSADQRSGDQAGQRPGEQAPDGSPAQKPSSSGASSPNNPSKASPDQSSQQQENQSPDQGSQQAGGNTTSPPQGGGARHGDSTIAPQPDAPDQEDEANLKFAQEQTDLVLNRLDEQLSKKQVDRNLLDRLGWNEDELRRFVERWHGLKAKGADGSTNEELNAALRSLGLRPGGPQRIRAAAKADKLRDLNEGYRSRAPLEYADRVRAYVKGAAASGDAGEADK